MLNFNDSFTIIFSKKFATLNFCRENGQFKLNELTKNNSLQFLTENIVSEQKVV